MDENEELVYLAGFFDGEGSVQIVICNDTFSLHMSVSQRVSAPLEIYAQRFGSKVAFYMNHGHEQYRWTVSGRHAGAVLRQLLPYLIVKAEVAQWGIWVADTILVRTGGGRMLSKEVKEFREIARDAVHRLNVGHRKEA